ncbi:MAG TPA: hypothetical protein DD727_04025 [Clostridiales bacterium]|nr:hypothetical protein [Clostridiales bacterium]
MGDATDIVTISKGDIENEKTGNKHAADRDNNVISSEYGRGNVVWIPESLGKRYFLNEKERDRLLPEIIEMIGESAVLKAQYLSRNIGIFCWKSEDEKTYFIDLVNYDIVLEEDRVIPAKDLVMKMKVPDDAGKIESVTFCPDNRSKAASVIIEKGWAIISLDELIHFASVKLMFDFEEYGMGE